MKLAIVALLALALLPPVAAAPLPGTCGDPCVIEAASAGYSPLASVISTGASVVWHSADITHITRDTGVTAGSAACFEVIGAMGEDAPAVRFDIEGLAVVATVDGVSTPCANAVATPAGAVIPYFCSIHPTMRGVLVVAGV